MAKKAVIRDGQAVPRKSGRKSAKGKTQGGAADRSALACDSGTSGGGPVLEWWAAEALTGHPLNWRTHPPGQSAALEALKAEVGWAGVIVFNRRTGYVLDGHLNLELAMREPARKVPVFVVDVPAADEALALTTFDSLGSHAEGDPRKFRELVDEVRGEWEGMAQELGAMMAGVQAELDELARPMDDPLADLRTWWLEVRCGDEATQEAIYRRLVDKGYEVRVGML